MNSQGRRASIRYFAMASLFASSLAGVTILASMQAPNSRGFLTLGKGGGMDVLMMGAYDR